MSQAADGAVAGLREKVGWGRREARLVSRGLPSVPSRVRLPHGGGKTQKVPIAQQQVPLSQPEFLGESPVHIP